MINKSAYFEAMLQFRKEIIQAIISLLIIVLVLICTFSISYYFAFIFLPLLAMSFVLGRKIKRLTYIAYEKILLTEKYWPDGIHYEYLDDTTHVKSLFNLKDGKRHGLVQSFYRNGKVLFEGHYYKGVPIFPGLLYNRDGIIVRKSDYGKGRLYLCNSEEFYEDGTTRMIEDKWKYSFFDSASRLKCVIFIKSKPIEIKEYRSNLENCWYKNLRHNGVKVLCTPSGKWQEFNNDGSLHKELIFGNAYPSKKGKAPIKQIVYNADGSVQTILQVKPKKLNIERYHPCFGFERLVDKKAEYILWWVNPGPNIHEKFDIPVVLGLEDLLEVY